METAPASVAWGLVVLLATGCAPGPRLVDQPLDQGDVVIAVVDAEHPSIARVELIRADDRGRVALSLDPEASLALAILRARDGVAADGQPAPLDQLSVDLLGDAGASCGCSAPALDLPQRIGSGDRCALPPALPLTALTGALDDALEDALRARLRLQWPGPCASRPRAPLAEASELTVCPLGTGARRLAPGRTTVGTDGTLVGVTRGRVVEIDPAGVVHETAIEPALRKLVAAVSLGARGTLVAADALGALSQSRTDLVLVPARGAGDAVRLGGSPGNFTLHGMFVADAEPRVWLHGAALDGLASRGALFRCRLRGDAIECRGGPLDDEPDCPSLSRESVAGVVRLAGGAYVGITGDAHLFTIHDDAPRCLREARAPPVLTRDGRPVEVKSTERLVGTGRRVVACMVGMAQDDRVALIATATIGAWGAGPPVTRWETLADVEGFDAYCGHTAFVDPRAPDRAVITFGDEDGLRALSIAAASTTIDVREVDPERLFPELSQHSFQVATTSSSIGLTTQAGEMWSARSGPLERRLALDPPGSTRTTAVTPVPAGFLLAGGQGQDVVVRVPPGDGCDDIALEASPSAFDGAARDDVLVALGDRVLAFGARAGQPELRVLDDPSPRVLALPGPARAVSAAEIVPGRSVAFVRSDGTLWSTDGASVEVLDGDPARGWRTVSGAGGIGWVASASALGRLLPRPSGGLRLEADVLQRIGRARFDAVTRDMPPQLTAVRALSGGGALVAFQEQISGTVLGAIDDVTVWWIEEQRGALVLEPYEALVDRGSRPVYPQIIAAIGGPEHAPLLVFAGTDQSIGLGAPGSPVSAAPFAGLLAASTHGREVLLIGPDLRLTLVRVR